MKSIHLLVLLFCLVSSTASRVQGQGFINMNFESASTQPSIYVSQDSRLIAWNTALPGWSGNGGTSGYVYHGSEHLGFSGYHLLVDSTSPYYAPGSNLAGNYSVAFASGHQTGDSSSPWVNAYISQSGTIPVGTYTIRLLAAGPFQVFVGGTSIAMQSLGGNSYVGNVSSFAGSFAELRIVNTATTVHTPTIVDNISFSAVPVPEPSSVALLGVGVGLVICASRKLRRTDPGDSGPQ